MSFKHPTTKMSKSHRDSNSRIHLTDSPESIQQKVRLALTDSMCGVSYDPTHRPGVSNLLEILSHIQDGHPSPSELSKEFQDMEMKSFKQHVAARITTYLSEYRERFKELLYSDISTDKLQKVAQQGSFQAIQSASVTLDKVYRTVGLRG